MILPLITQLNNKRIVLASGSPRRKELLKVIGLNKFEVCRAKEPCYDPPICHDSISILWGCPQDHLSVMQHPVMSYTMTWSAAQIIVSTFEEDLPKHHFDNAAEYAVETARHKALDVARMCAAQTDKPPVDLIISADTVSSSRGGRGGGWGGVGGDQWSTSAQAGKRLGVMVGGDGHPIEGGEGPRQHSSARGCNPQVGVMVGAGGRGGGHLDSWVDEWAWRWGEEWGGGVRSVCVCVCVCVGGWVGGCGYNRQG